MERGGVTPTERESPFGIEELFFSRTDRKGLIRSGNDVFVRVSGWSEDELVGAPHNVIRHPDMPRAVFRLLWDTLLAGQPVAAYVKNMARDGAFYWVMATVVPQGDGFLSVRLKPGGPHFEAAQAVYPELLAFERRLESRGTPRKEVVDASLDRLGEMLAGAGFPTYLDFMRAALPTEIRARDAALGRQPRGVADDALGSAGALLDRLFDAVIRYEEMHTALASGLQTVQGFAEDIRLGALNALMAATHLEGRATTLGTVADLMGASARDVAGDAEHLTAVAAPTLERLHDLAFRVSLAKVQVDMARFFAAELRAARADGVSRPDRAADLSGLVDLLGDAVRGLLEVRTSMERGMAAMRGDVIRLVSRLDVLSALDVAGRIEIAGIQGAESVVVLFDRIRAQLADASSRITALRDAVLVREAGVDTRVLLGAADHAARQVAALAA